MSLYTDFKTLVLDIKAVGESIKTGPVKEQFYTLRDKALDLQGKALDVEHRHLEEMAALKSQHAQAVEALQAENADLKRQLEALRHQPEPESGRPSYGGDNRLDF